jgi:hypothetical protein
VRRALLLVLLAGCPDPSDSVELFALTNPPPAATGVVTNDDGTNRFEVELSPGVALGLACWNYCSSSSIDQCSITPEDPTIVAVRSLYRVSANDRTDSVIAAKRTGTTRLFVSSACATREYVVRVR